MVIHLNMQQLGVVWANPWRPHRRPHRSAPGWLSLCICSSYRKTARFSYTPSYHCATRATERHRATISPTIRVQTLMVIPMNMQQLVEICPIPPHPSLLLRHPIRIREVLGWVKTGRVRPPRCSLGACMTVEMTLWVGIRGLGLLGSSTFRLIYLAFSTHNACRKNWLVPVRPPDRPSQT